MKKHFEQAVSNGESEPLGSFEQLLLQKLEDAIRISCENKLQQYFEKTIDARQIEDAAEALFKMAASGKTKEEMKSELRSSSLSVLKDIHP